MLPLCFNPSTSGTVYLDTVLHFILLSIKMALKNPTVIHEYNKNSELSDLFVTP